ncbi:hypothetical protein Clacol_007653 [Clathrus columnatus]|uniref:Uncharacterized protein n=1 Tax=Clathrus columnatus TaxID=1419009 RepID=A0AAV5AJV7_9AGAM|nr:hypothetical protein Clacol_007653 [Clathrus columnatus]
MSFGKRKHSEIQESGSILDSDSSTLNGTPISPVKRVRMDSANNEENNVPAREGSPTHTDAGVEEEENEVLLIIIPEDDHSVVKRDTFTEQEAAPATDTFNSDAQVEDPVQSNESVTDDEQPDTPQQKYTLPTSAVDAILPLSTTVFFLDSRLASQPTESFVKLPPPKEGPFNSPTRSPVIPQGAPTASQPALGTVLSHTPLGLLPPASPLAIPASETLKV